MSYRLILLCAGAVTLAGCAASTGTSSRSAPSSGGSAGQMGPNYCHTLPADLSDRRQWESLCFRD